LAEREGFVSSGGIEKRQVVGMPISTVLTMSTLFEKSVRKRYTGLHAIRRQTVKTFCRMARGFLFSLPSGLLNNRCPLPPYLGELNLRFSRELRDAKGLDHFAMGVPDYSLPPWAAMRSRITLEDVSLTTPSRVCRICDPLRPRHRNVHDLSLAISFIRNELPYTIYTRNFVL
jgi:hypothetical protein